jgi:hypothetical protein
MFVRGNQRRHLEQSKFLEKIASIFSDKKKIPANGEAGWQGGEDGGE